MVRAPREAQTFRSKPALVVIAAAVMLVVAACGVSDDAVKAVDTTTTSTTSTTTTSTTSTTVAETTTTKPDSKSKKGSEWPKAAKTEFMDACTDQDIEGIDEVCECALRGIQKEVSVEDLMDVGLSGDLPPELEAVILEYTADCVEDPESH